MTDSSNRADGPGKSLVGGLDAEGSRFCASDRARAGLHLDSDAPERPLGAALRDAE